MTKLLLLLLAIGLSTVSSAQQASRQIADNVFLSASNHLAYPDPSDAALTPAPDGYVPFYISHYGRHGSRYLIDSRDYDVPLSALKTAADEGKLTELGLDVLARLSAIKTEAEGRYGELSPLGALQHRQIANRMFNRFPEVFEGDVWVDARSTIVIRCILSMENELLELARLNPNLRFKSDASEHDMYYMNFTDRPLFDKRRSPEADAQMREYRDANLSESPLIAKLFADTTYAKSNINIRDFYDRLFKVASTIQNTEARNSISLYDLYTPEELYVNWTRNNMSWYSRYGAYAGNGATQPFSQRNLLRRIISEADSCITLQRPGASLRFGHETMVLPLTCLLGLNGYDLQTADLSILEEKGWICYNIFPMGANIQIVFYRNPEATAPDDILIKVLLNEREASLPIEPVTGPYYRYSDFRAHYLKKIADYEKAN